MPEVEDESLDTVVVEEPDAAVVVDEALLVEDVVDEGPALRR